VKKNVLSIACLGQEVMEDLLLLLLQTWTGEGIQWLLDKGGLMVNLGGGEV
jgi:hypothetical protein